MLADHLWARFWSSTLPFLSSQASVDVALRTWGLYASRLMYCNFWRWMQAQTWFIYSDIHRMDMDILWRFDHKARTSQNFWKEIGWPQIWPHMTSWYHLHICGTDAKTSSMCNYNGFPNATKWQTLLRSLKPQSLQRQRPENLQTASKCQQK